MKSKKFGTIATLASSALLAGVLAGCGGGGGGGADSSAAAGGGGGGGGEVGGGGSITPVTLSGTVMIDQAIRNAVVCMDLNANNACDATEPKSAATGLNGAYSLTYDPAAITAAQVAAASLIAPMVPGPITSATATIDAADAANSNTAKPYVLKQVPGKSGQINPLTTLVTAGVAGGMTEAAARANVVIQLALPAEAKIDNYQDDPTSATLFADNARFAAKITAAGLEDGAVLSVGDQLAAVSAADGDLNNLAFTDANNYNYRTNDTLAKPAGTAGSLLRFNRAGKTAGVATTDANLYDDVYLGTTGWVLCDRAVSITSTLGNPSRTASCAGTNKTISARIAQVDISNQSMATVVNNMQTFSETNTITGTTASIAALSTLLGTTTFPAGSAQRPRILLTMNRPVFVNNVNTDGQSTAVGTTLEQWIAARPASAVVAGNSGGTIGLGFGSTGTKNLRVAFTSTTTPSGAVQFYECNLDPANLNVVLQGTCVALTGANATGTYTITTENGARLLRFAGAPITSNTTQNHTRFLAEVKGINVASIPAGGQQVFIVRQNKPDVDSNIQTGTNRLNATAWAAMKAKLALP